ncbi:hypothetical protein [Streptomyces sp. NPDC051561]|uniref:hypothetical protein n=1 Tax=Streptomyces sp. NPDC051561 TaxID=3365658 RepID=UPI00378C233C
MPCVVRCVWPGVRLCAWPGRAASCGAGHGTPGAEEEGAGVVLCAADADRWTGGEAAGRTGVADSAGAGVCRTGPALDVPLADVLLRGVPLPD